MAKTRAERAYAKRMIGLTPIDHKATGKKLKEMQHYLNELEIQTYNQGNHKWTRSASRRIGSMLKWLLRVKSDLEEQHALDDPDWDVSTYYGE